MDAKSASDLRQTVEQSSTKVGANRSTHMRTTLGVHLKNNPRHAPPSRKLLRALAAQAASRSERAWLLGLGEDAPRHRLGVAAWGFGGNARGRVLVKWGVRGPHEVGFEGPRVCSALYKKKQRHKLRTLSGIAPQALCVCRPPPPTRAPLG